MVAYAIAPTPKLISPVITLPRISQRRHGTFMSNLLLECKVFARQTTPDERFGYSPCPTGDTASGAGHVPPLPPPQWTTWPPVVSVLPSTTCLRSPKSQRNSR